MASWDLYVFTVLIYGCLVTLEANLQGLFSTLLAYSEQVVRVTPELTGNTSLYILSLISVITSCLTSSFGKRGQERKG